jgi:hypothetical protein
MVEMNGQLERRSRIAMMRGLDEAWCMIVVIDEAKVKRGKSNA